MGPILEFVVLEGVMERLFLWSLRRQFTEDMKLEQLRMYQMLLSQARQPLLHHKPVLRPLMMLLASCAGAGTGELALKQFEKQFCIWGNTPVYFLGRYVSNYFLAWSGNFPEFLSLL